MYKYTNVNVKQQSNINSSFLIASSLVLFLKQTINLALYHTNLNKIYIKNDQNAKLNIKTIWD